MTSEHVFPLWTRKVVLPDVRGDSGYVFKGESGEYELVPGMPVAALEVKRVCARCNNGWLGDLEQGAKPLLTRPIQGNPASFHFVDVETIATWAFKTCILADLASSRLLAALPFRWLCQRGRPPGEVTVTMGAYGSGRYPQYAYSAPVNYKVEGLGGPLDLNAYLITISIGHLVFQVFGHHLRNVLDLTPSDWKRDFSRVIWPPKGSVRWPPTRMLDDDQLFRFAGSHPPTAEERASAVWRYPLRSASAGAPGR